MFFLVFWVVIVLSISSSMWTGMVSDARSDQVYSIKVVNEFPHDPTTFTQILALHKMDDSYFGEGLTLLGERFLSKKCPLIRAYGAKRFDATANMSYEWKSFGSFYFIVPQVELDELEGSSMLDTTVAWDTSLSWTYAKAITALQSIVQQVSSMVMSLQKEVPNTCIISNNYIPNKVYWDLAVNRALQMINRNKSPLIKIVLARCSRVMTSTNINPLAWLACLQVVDGNSYQFCTQPPDAKLCKRESTKQFHNSKITSCWHPTRSLGGLLGRIKCG